VNALTVNDRKGRVLKLLRLLGESFQQRLKVLKESLSNLHIPLTVHQHLCGVARPLIVIAFWKTKSYPVAGQRMSSWTARLNKASENKSVSKHKPVPHSAPYSAEMDEVKAKAVMSVYFSAFGQTVYPRIERLACSKDILFSFVTSNDTPYNGRVKAVSLNI
jgi:hypothetical protein